MVKKRVYDRAHAGVRFYAEDLDPLTITLALRLPSDHVHRNGEPRLSRSKKGRVTEFAAYRQGMWSMSSEAWVQSPRLAVHLEWLLDELEPKAEAIARLLSSGVRVDFYCYSSGSTAEPPSLARSIRARAAALGIDIQIDHYELSRDEARP